MVGECTNAAAASHRSAWNSQLQRENDGREAGSVLLRRYVICTYGVRRTEAGQQTG